VQDYLHVARSPLREIFVYQISEAVVRWSAGCCGCLGSQYRCEARVNHSIQMRIMQIRFDRYALVYILYLRTSTAPPSSRTSNSAMTTALLLSKAMGSPKGSPNVSMDARKWRSGEQVDCLPFSMYGEKER
jgi:hypothetical protein